jgi:hypothetical protein
MRRLQTDAATMTPAANPVSARWTVLERSFFMKNTQAAPSEVPANGISRPHTTFISIPSITQPSIPSTGIIPWKKGGLRRTLPENIGIFFQKETGGKEVRCL